MDKMGDVATKRQTQKGLVNRLKQHGELIFSKIKNFLGLGNKEDIARIYGEQVFKGFSTEGVQFAKGIVKYKMQGMNPENAVKFVNKQIKDILENKDVSKGGRSDFIRYIGELAQLGDDFKVNKATLPELQQFSSTLESIPFKQRIKYANNLEKLRLFKNVEKMAASLKVNSGTYGADTTDETSLVSNLLKYPEIGKKAY